MGQIKLYIACSIDGKIARKDGSVDWLPEPENGEDYGYGEFYSSIDSLIMGYGTYETCISLGDWPYKGKASFVYSRDGSKKVIDDAQLITHNPIAHAHQLKENTDGDIWLVGGGNLIQQFHDAGLIDEYIIAFIPVILGAGIELFPNLQKEEKLTLVRHRIYQDGLALMEYKKG